MKIAIAIISCVACYNAAIGEQPDTRGAGEVDSSLVGKCVAQAGEYMNAESWSGARYSDGVDEARAAVAEVIKGFDTSSGENRQELSRSIRVAAARASMYEMITEELCRAAIQEEVAESYPTLVEVGARTQHGRVASLILVWLKGHDVKGRFRVLERWVEPSLIHPDWLAAIITQGLAGEDWGLQWSPVEQPVDRAKRQAYQYLQEHREERE